MFFASVTVLLNSVVFAEIGLLIVNELLNLIMPFSEVAVKYASLEMLSFDLSIITDEGYAKLLPLIRLSIICEEIIL